MNLNIFAGGLTGDDANPIRWLLNYFASYFSNKTFLTFFARLRMMDVWVAQLDWSKWIIKQKRKIFHFFNSFNKQCKKWDNGFQYRLNHCVYIYRVVFFNWSAWFSVPKWKNLLSQGGAFLNWKFRKKLVLFGCNLFFILVLKIGRTS